MRHVNYIITDRLFLRPLMEDDLICILNWRNHEDTRKWFINSDIILPEQQIYWYQKYLNDEKDMMFIVEETLNLKAPIGAIALYNIDYESSTAELGRFMIGNFKARSQGFGLECVKGVCNFAFQNLQFKKITLEVFEDNESAIKIYRKAGFKTMKRTSKDKECLLYMELTDTK